ncbi:MAG: response regulator [Candidatus Wildermuthbacteria bacterium]|nr:response regulator [Candidatus Wildermuthbacteria bacterium]
MQKILVIEDDKFLRDLLLQKLAKEGYESLEALDGTQGLKKIQEEKPNLVVLDLILPGMDGFEVLRLAKENQETAHIPLLVLSNLGEREDVERALKLGAADFMVKSQFTPGEIVSRIKSILG